MTLAAEVLKARQLYDWLVANRARHNVRLVPYKQAARTIISALRDNEFVGFFLDLGIGYDHRGVPVRFFGKTAYFPAAPALLAHHTGAPIIQGFAVIGDDGLIHGHSFPAIRQDKSLSRDAFVQSVTQQFATNMEEFIGKHPEQWYIFRRIWPDQPLPVEAHETYPLLLRPAEGPSRMTYWLYRAAASLLPRVHESIGYPLFDLLGALAYLLSGSARSLVSRNMRHMLGPGASEADVQRYTREAFRNLARNYYDLFHMRGFTRETLRARMDIAGLENLDRALERGKGVLLTSPHFGNTEYLMQVPTLYPYMHFMLLVEQMDDVRLFELLRALRAGMGMDMATVAEPLKVVRRLKQNGVVGIAFDRDVTNSGIDTEFFGQPAVFPVGVIRLAMRTGAAIVPAYGWRADERGRFQVRVFPALELVKTGDAEADVQTNLRRLLDFFEPVIRERPGQWMAFHEVWKSARRTLCFLLVGSAEAAEGL